MWKITLVKNGFVVGVFYNRADTEEEAIYSAALFCADTYDTARAEWLEDVA